MGGFSPPNGLRALLEGPSRLQLQLEEVAQIAAVVAGGAVGARRRRSVTTVHRGRPDALLLVGVWRVSRRSGDVARLVASVPELDGRCVTVIGRCVLGVEMGCAEGDMDTIWGGKKPLGADDVALGAAGEAFHDLEELDVLGPVLLVRRRQEKILGPSVL